jgi:putative AbiEii toxin of type IV toxin-antitoxin system
LKELYIGPFRNAINIGTRDEYFDIQVGQGFVRTWRSYKTGSIRSQNEAAYRVSERIGQIFDFERFEVNPSPDDETLQVFINGKSYKLNELGSGLAQFVIVLANAAIKAPSYILIDEPELNLHPSLQVDFLTTLATYATHGVLFSTHSFGLARATADQIYATQRLGQSQSQVRPIGAVPRLSDFLGELGFSGYKELGFDKILLVEGASELRTIQRFLRFFKKEHRVVMLHLGGSSLISGQRELELQEVKRISPNVAALIDSERDSATSILAKDRQGFLEICERAQIQCCVLERRAIENYLCDRAVKKIKGGDYRALGPYERLKDVTPFGWAKSENWRIAEQMTLEDLSQTDLARFLEGL